MSTMKYTLRVANRLLGTGSNIHNASTKKVVEGIAERKPISVDTNDLAEESAGFWDNAADRVASVGGSWPFIFGFFIFLMGWIAINSIVLAKADEAVDPYPFIFLNLILSMLAAIQAPIIMMSQNRQSQKDRIAASHDYEVNLRSEIEILSMHEKIDMVRNEQHERLLAQQQEMLDLIRKIQMPQK